MSALVIWASVQLLEEEISDMGQVLAKVHASEAALLSQEVQLKESNARLEKSLDEETKANEKAQMLIREYEKGVEKRCCFPQDTKMCVASALKGGSVISDAG